MTTQIPTSSMGSAPSASPAAPPTSSTPAPARCRRSPDGRGGRRRRGGGLGRRGAKGLGRAESAAPRPGVDAVRRLVNANIDELAELLSLEHGKTVADARGDIQRGIEVIEFCLGIPHLLKGEYSEGAGPGIDVYSLRQPLGRGRRHHPVQLPGDDPVVEGRAGPGLRKCVRAQAK